MSNSRVTSASEPPGESAIKAHALRTHVSQLEPLSDAPGDEAIVAVPGATDPEVMAFLQGLGLTPGNKVVVREKHPFDGPMVLSVDGQDRTLGSKVAHQIYVQKTQ